ncbi:MAG: hypothetical protein JWM57_2830 [Phycisphaerales bacterium]|nr:hypothetical protein [Phycisphaerales bacterium]
MASISHGKTGSTRILFICPTSATPIRRTIRPGRLNKHDQLAWKGWIESIATSKRLNAALEPRAVSWLAALPDQTYAKIAAADLVPPRHAKAIQRTDVAGFFDDYLASLQIKASTKTTYEQTKRTLAEFFGAKADLSDITPVKAAKFRDWMANDQLLAPATISRRLKMSQHAMKKAVKWKLIAENPFEDIKAGPQTNPSRQAFVTRETIDKVIAACPDDEWRAIVALARFGGLRSPSEILMLRWADIDWAAKRFTVYSKKNERFEGKRLRIVPLFPELEPVLLRLLQGAKGGQEFVITRYRMQSANLRTQLKRIIRKAGVESWERLFNNLRASRETELARDYPLHVACYWIGNSPKVASDHYLQVREGDFEQAVKKAAQNAAQYTPAPIGKEQQVSNVDPHFEANIPLLAGPCGPLQAETMSLVGFEPTTLRLKVACSTN